MVPLTRRRLLRQTVVGGGLVTTAGCATPNVPNLSGGKSVPTPFTNDAYKSSYVATGRWPMDGHDGGRTGHADTTVPRGDVGVAWLRRPGNDPHGATAPVVGPERVYVAYSESPEDAEQPTVHLAGWDADSGEQRLAVPLGTGRAVGLVLADETLVVVTRGAEYEEATVTALARRDGSVRWSETVPDVTRAARSCGRDVRCCDARRRRRRVRLQPGWHPTVAERPSTGSATPPPAATVTASTSD